MTPRRQPGGLGHILAAGASWWLLSIGFRLVKLRWAEPAAAFMRWARRCDSRAKPSVELLGLRE